MPEIAELVRQRTALNEKLHRREKRIARLSVKMGHAQYRRDRIRAKLAEVEAKIQTVSKRDLIPTN